MAETYSSKVVFASTAEQISRLLQLDQGTAESWEPDDLRSMARHQMAAPLDFDLGSSKLNEPRQKSPGVALTNAARSEINTFEDLFTHSHPPLELLKLSQKFFKQNVAMHPKGSVEQKVAYLFYLLSIVVARVRAGVKISKLTDDEQRQAIKSMMGQPWVDDEIKELLAEGRKRLASAAG
jgi:hypothetical protein